MVTTLGDDTRYQSNNPLALKELTPEHLRHLVEVVITRD